MAAGRMKESYVGPKDPETGEIPESAPPYIHQSFPTFLFHPDWPGWPREGRLYFDAESVTAALADGWVLNPAELGEITEPSLVQIREKAEAEFRARQAARGESERAVEADTTSLNAEKMAAFNAKQDARKAKSAKPE